MKNETRLFLRLTLLNPTPEEASEIRSLVADPQAIDWAYFDRIVRANVYRPYLLYQMESLGIADRLPEALRAQWVLERDSLKEKLERRFEQAKRLFRSMNERGIPVVVLKGTGLSHQIYKNPYYKKSNDIDILIQTKDLPRIYDLYDEMGFIPFGERVEKNKKTQEKVAWHATPYLSRDLTLTIGTQWGIKTLLANYRVDYPKLWSRIEDLDFQGEPLKILSPEDTMLHLCLHLGFFKTQMKDLGDVVNLLRFHRKRFKWDEFIQDAIRANAAAHAYQAFYLANSVHRMPEVERSLEKLRPHAWAHYVSAVEKKTRDMDEFVFLSVDWIQEVEIQMTLFLNSDGFAQKCRAFLGVWRTILFPDTESMLKMNFVLKANPVMRAFYRVRTPWVILRALAEELGWKIIALLSVKTVLDLTKAAFQAITGRSAKPISPYAHLAKALGKTEEEVERFVKEFC